jgi:peptidoglycan/LPS O-acetylase OafA/YrhL
LRSKFSIDACAARGRTAPHEAFEYIRGAVRRPEGIFGLALNKQQNTTAPAMERQSAWGYRPAIDGLRTVAVVSVLLFHFDRRFLGGGFVGVDVFFVISGYLIGSVLLADIEGGRFSLARFYQRRIARIFPAFATVIAVTLAFGWLIYSSLDFASLGANAAAAALSVINIKLLFQGNYFALSEDAQPILHYWTLAVEEQFYLTFPIYLYLITRLGRRPILINLWVGGVSFAACIAVTYFNPSYAFYLLPTRAWELLAGSSLALAEWKGFQAGNRHAAIAAWAGMVLLVMSFLGIRQNDQFPGWIAAFPVIGAVLVLTAMSNRDLLLVRLLSHPVPVAVGKLSYSLYLWHWAVFSLIDYRFFALGNVSRGALKVAITIIASLMTYRVVEKPLRAVLNKPVLQLPTFVGTALTIASLSVVGILVRDNYYLNAAPARIVSGGIAIAGGSGGSVVLAGDSQASMYGTELASLAREKGFMLNIVSVAGGNQLPGLSSTYWPDVSAFIAQRRPDVVILVNAWSAKIATDTEPVRAALADMKGHVGHVILLAQQPTAPPAASRKGIREGARPPFFEEPDARAARMTATAGIERFASDWVIVRDVSPIFLGRNDEIRLISENGRLTYQDSTHLSDAGTALVRPLLAKAIASAFGYCSDRC